VKEKENIKKNRGGCEREKESAREGKLKLKKWGRERESERELD
jgi:hypothetical protein